MSLAVQDASTWVEKKSLDVFKISFLFVLSVYSTSNRDETHQKYKLPLAQTETRAAVGQ